MVASVPAMRRTDRPPPASLPFPVAAVAAVVEAAVRGHQVLRIDYRDRSGALSRRAVEPVAVVAQGPHWYLVAWCRLRQETRAFRTDRIERALPTGEAAPEYDLEGLVPAFPDPAARAPAAD